MLNFRYHVVSLVAVFLSLGIGVLIGAGALDSPTVEFLQNRIDTVEANAEARRADNDALQGEVERLEQTLGALEPFTVTDRSIDANVLVVAVRGVEPETMEGIVELARVAGADAPGVLWIEDKWTLTAADDREALASALNVTESRRSVLRARGWEALADRLRQGAALTSDVLSSLTDAEFITFEAVGPEVALTELGGLGTEVLLVVGTDAVVGAKHVLVPAAQAAVDAGLSLAAAELFIASEDGPERGSLVAFIRNDEALAAEVATVDDLDLPSGSAVAVLALADLQRGVVGHYGFGEGATALTPTFWQP